MNTSNSVPVCPLPCSILDAASQSACVSVCKGERRLGKGEGEVNKITMLQMYNARVSEHKHAWFKEYMRALELPTKCKYCAHSIHGSL